MRQSILSEGELSEHKGFRRLEIEEFNSDEIQESDEADVTVNSKSTKLS